jgi:hypothetical protein
MGTKKPFDLYRNESSALVLKVGKNQKLYQAFGTNNLFVPAITDGNSSLGKSF